MKKLQIALLSFASAVVLNAQPVVSSAGIVSAATYKAGIAQGSMFVVFGSGLSSDAITNAGVFPLPASLAGTSVSIQSGGQTHSVPLVYTSATQLSGILPSATPTGSATLTVTYNGRQSTPAQFNVVRSSFGMFTNNARGNGPAVAQNYVSDSVQTRNGLATSAKPGQVVTLWGTGLGPISGDDAGTPPVGDLDTPLEVLVGGQSARVIYKGRSGCCAGIDQIVVEVPQQVEGCYAPMQIRSGGSAIAQDATLSVAQGSVCTEPGLLTAADLEKARTAGNLKVGSLLLTRYAFGDQAVFDYGILSFSRPRYEELARTNERLLASAPGTCEAASWDGNSLTSTGSLGQLDADFFGNYLFWSSHSPIDAGARISLSGSGKNVWFDRSSPGFYFNTFIDTQNPAGYMQGYLTPGDYTLDSGSGGADVPGFRTSIKIPEHLRFTGPANQSIPRSSDLTLTWTGGSQNERILIYGASWSQSGLVGGAFTCLQRGVAGRFTVPSSILSVLPRSGDYRTGQGAGMLMIYSFSPYQRSSVNGLDAFYAATLNLNYKQASFE